MLFAVINTVKNIFPVFQKFSLCYSKLPSVFPVWKKNQIPCFPCSVATLFLNEITTLLNLGPENPLLFFNVVQKQ